MNEIPLLVTDLALILSAAAVTTVIFRRLKQPLVLGYLLAGLLVSPNTSFFPSVIDHHSIEVWAEIGVIFLLFNLGLEFSFKKLVKVGGAASVAGLFEVSCMLAIGFGAGKLFGWSNLDSLFLGGIISISSTTIIIRVFDEFGLKSRRFVGVVLGILIIEDLVAVVLMVLLSTIAISNQFAGLEMIESVLKLIFFLVLWFLSGIFIFPSLIKKFRKHMNDEMTLITSIASCFLMVGVAARAGFSPALGAFIMGSILAETILAENIEHQLKSVKELFGAIFFVSVGMLIDVSVLIENAGTLAILVLIVVVGKSVFVTIGALISGQTLRTSVQTGLSLAQIGEFSFIIASLGVSLKVTSSFLYPIAVGISVITTFTTPYSIQASEKIYAWLSKAIPVRWYNFLNKYSNSSATIRSTGHWNEVLRSYFQIIVTNSVVIIGILVVSYQVVMPFIADRGSNGESTDLVLAIGTFLVMSPFLWALVFKRSNRASHKALWADRSLNRGPLIFLELLKVILAVLFISILLSLFLSLKAALIVSGVIIVPVFVVFYQKLQKFYDRIESRFIENLHERERQRRGTAHAILPPWDVHLAMFDLKPHCPLIGKPLHALHLREDFGINIVHIKRGEWHVFLPKPDEMLFPGDHIEVIGTDDQLAEFRKVVDSREANGAEVFDTENNPVVLERIEIRSSFCIVGKSIRESGIRESTNGLVVGLERNGNRKTNPKSSEIIKIGDILWIAGDRLLIKNYLKTIVPVE